MLISCFGLSVDNLVGNLGVRYFAKMGKGQSNLYIYIYIFIFKYTYYNVIQHNSRTFARTYIYIYTYIYIFIYIDYISDVLLIRNAISTPSV